MMQHATRRFKGGAPPRSGTKIRRGPVGPSKMDRVSPKKTDPIISHNGGHLSNRQRKSGASHEGPRRL